MPAYLNENQQVIDPDTNTPLLNGKIFFGAQGSDPQAVPIQVFSDRALKIVVPQPVRTDSAGRTTLANGTRVKIWIPARYSVKIQNSAGAQKMIDLDAGASATVGITVLTDIGGTANAITAQSDPITTFLEEGQQFTLKATAINTDKMTLAIGSIPPKPIKFNFNEQMAPGFIQANQTINITYNSTGAPSNDFFVWNNEGRGVSLLTTVAGDGNVITAVGGPSIAGYVDEQIYPFIPNITNTGNVTLKVGALPTVSIKAKGLELLKKQLLANVPALVMFNSIGPVFELLNTSGRVVFTPFASTGTWTPKAQSTTALILCIGGGGGGGGLASGTLAGGGGGASGTALTFVNSLDTSYLVTIGIAGTAGSSASGGVGGASSVGSIAVSPGGAGGGGNSTGSGGFGGIPTTATIVIVGGDGQSADQDAASAGGNGGASFLGGGGRGQNSDTTPRVGAAFGSGGGGARATASAGAAGAPGIVFIIEFS